MKRFDPAVLERFKNEFRTVQDFRHRNCVKLFELFEHGEQWFFTMELIEGRTILDYLGAVGINEPTMPPPSSDSWNETDAHFGVSAEQAAFTSQPARDVQRLLTIFQELAEAIVALHDNRILHRDIKPSNVMVDDGGSAKLLDFGLAKASRLEEKSVTEHGPAGTFLWMAPEQADDRATQASDWFSFGAILYEALTGRHPFRDTAQAMPWNRQNYSPPSVRTLAADVPEQLGRLCDELLKPRAADRPGGRDILTRLGLASPPPPAPSPPFVGRERHLKELHLAFKDTQRGGAVTVLLHGSSGVGKTGLVEHFLSSLRQQQNQVVVLRGRCYERESVPYKALDGLIDNLSRYWRRLPRARAAELLPDDIGPLVRVFPVLLRVEIVADLPRRDADYPDPQELRRRAFAALRQVLRRLGDRWPLVIHLDDLQWGDLDSALMLTALLLPPDAPRLLLLASFRSEDRHTSPFLSSFLQTSVSALGTEPREMALDVLSPQEARDLASRLLVGQDNAYCSNGSQLAQMAEMAARESGGNAFFVYQMVQAMQAGDPEVDLDKVIWNRCLALPENQRRLVEVVALASRPVHGAIALRAAGLGNQGTPNLIDLQKAKWLRPCPGDKVETYHDRIRETVVRHLSLEELTAHHGRLATALEAWGHADAEMLAIHYQGAGNNERAAVKYIIAAGNAADTLAFDQAAKLYRLALELRPVEGEQQIRLLTHLGDALANAGRGAEAAQVYLDAAQCAPPGYVLDLQRRAADQLLRAGRIEEGLDVLQRVLRSVGETYPKTPRRALLALLWGRLRLWWRGAKFRERDASQIPPRELERLDACWTAASILSLTDIIRGLAFHARHYILALQAGDPSRIALALATQAVVHAVTGDPRQNAKAEALLHKVREMATWQGQPYLRGLADNMEGGAALLMGQWKKACELCARAEETFRKECKGAAWERGVACNVRFTAMAATGEFLQVAQELPGLLHEAHERGDLFTATNLRLHAVMLELAADQPQQALQTVQDAMKQWPAQGYHFQHSNEFRFQMLVALYTGQPQQAWQIANAGWPRLQQSLLLRVQSAWAGPKAYMLRAGMANLDGKPALAGELLVKAEAGFLAADMVLYAAVARRCRGLLRGGGEGQELIRTADAAMHAQLIRNPARFTNAVAPGFAEMA